MIKQRQIDAQRILDRFEPLESSVQDLCEMADERRRQRKLPEALLFCDEGVNAAKELDDVMAEAICLLHRWAIHYVGQKFPDAIDDSSRSKRLFEDLGESFAETNASIALGMSYEGQGLFFKSRGLDKRAKTSLQNAVRAYNYDRATELFTAMRGMVSFSRGYRKRDQHQDVLAELKQRYQQTLALYGQTAVTPSIRPLGDLVSIPVLGQPIAAGKPIPTLDDIEEYAQVIADRVIVGTSEYGIQALGIGRSTGPKPDAKGQCCFVVPVAGDSMDRAGISDGDRIILHRPKLVPLTPTTGDIIAAVIKGEDRVATLKHYRERGGKLLLEPESSNPENKTTEFSPAEFAKRIEVVGVAVAVLKLL